MSILNQTVLFMTVTTNGWCGKDVYQFTLDQIQKYSNLEDWGAKVVSLKVFKNTRDRVHKIYDDFSKLGFDIIIQINDDPSIGINASKENYAQYLIGGKNYLSDIGSSFDYISQVFPYLKYVHFIENDSPPILTNNLTLDIIVEASASLLSKEVNSVHLMRKSPEVDFPKFEYFDDSKAVQILPDFNFQNQTFLLERCGPIAATIAKNWEIIRHIHTERALKFIIEAIYGPQKYLVFDPDACYSIHTGVDNSEEIINNELKQ